MKKKITMRWAAFEISQSVKGHPRQANALIPRSYLSNGCDGLKSVLSRLCQER